MKKPKLRPRNPLLTIALARGGAGAHEQTTKALRRQDKMALQRELRDVRGSSRDGADGAERGRHSTWHRQGGAHAPLSLCHVA